MAVTFLNNFLARHGTLRDSPHLCWDFVWLEFVPVLYVAQPSLEKLLVVAANSRSDPQLDIMQRAGDFGVLTQPWMGVSYIPLLKANRSKWKRRQKDYKSQRS